MLERINNVMGRISIAGDESDWDFGFMQSLEEQFKTRGSLSPRQEGVLQQVEGRWSDEALKSRASWADQWDEEKEEKKMKTKKDCFLKVKEDYLRFLKKEEILGKSKATKIESLKKIYIPMSY